MGAKQKARLQFQRKRTEPGKGVKRPLTQNKSISGVHRKVAWGMSEIVAGGGWGSPRCGNSKNLQEPNIDTSRIEKRGKERTERKRIADASSSARPNCFNAGKFDSAFSDPRKTPGSSNAPIRKNQSWQ